MRHNNYMDMYDLKGTNSIDLTEANNKINDYLIH